jgi:hypothetical protein
MDVVVAPELGALRGCRRGDRTVVSEALTAREHDQGPAAHTAPGIHTPSIVRLRLRRTLEGVVMAVTAAVGFAVSPY